MRMAFVAYRGGRPGSANLSMAGIAQFTSGMLRTEDMKQAEKLIECDRFEDKSGNGIGLLVDWIPNRLEAAKYREGGRITRLFIARKVLKANKPMVPYRPPKPKEKPKPKVPDKIAAPTS